MPTLRMKVRLNYDQHPTPGTLYYECKRCGRKTKPTGRSSGMSAVVAHSA